MCTRTRFAIACARALFVSDVPTGSRPTKGQFTRAVDGAVRRCGGLDGCVTELAEAYGDYPETAAARMRWARGVAQEFAGVSGEEGADDA